MPDSKTNIREHEAKVPSLGLKHKDERQLIDMLLSSGEAWGQVETSSISDAYHLARQLHKHDTHKGKPYIYHVLRVANRIPGYLHIYEAEVITAAVLHDSVEDHSKAILDDLSDDTGLSSDPAVLQQVALSCLAERFNQRIAGLVDMVTNPASFSDLNYEDRLQAYFEKVSEAVKTPEGWMIKFSDWCDNGIGIIHGKEDLNVNRTEHFRRKYGSVAGVFKDRFNQPDIQNLMDDKAKTYVNQQLRLALDRLDVRGY